MSSKTEGKPATLPVSPVKLDRREVLRAAIQEGEDSGWIEDFNLDEFLAQMHKEAAEDGVRPCGSDPWLQHST